MSNQKIDLKYGLNDKIPGRRLAIYSLQHLLLFASGIIALPIAVGLQLGLTQPEIGTLLQRTFLICGAMSFLQAAIGHKYPISDGPAGLWGSMLILVGSSAAALGTDMASLRSEIELGVVITGVIILLLSVTGLITAICKVFTPMVNGVIMALMVLQMSQTFIKGALGVTAEDSSIDPKQVVVFIATMAIILFISTYMKGFIRSIASLIGIATGWILAVVLGVSSDMPKLGSFFQIPEILAWGRPSFDLGITITCIIGGLVLLSMTYASIEGMSEVLGEEFDNDKLKRSYILHGLTTVLSGLFAIVPFMPYVSSTGIVVMTRVATRKPFMIAALVLMCFGVISPVAAFFGSIPSVVAYGAAIVFFALIFGQGLKEFQKIELGNRECYIIGISMMFGIGIMFLPAGVFAQMPDAIHLLLSNGLVTGTLLAIALEQVFR